jgi:hypothetical protein
MKTLHQIYDDHETAAAVVRDLEAAGFTGNEVTLVGNFDASNGAEVGATTGALIGGGAGLLAALGVVAIPGIAPLVAAGWLMPLLAGSAVGTLVGSIIGALTDNGVPEASTHVYAETVRRGGALVIARVADKRAEAARAVLNRHRSADFAKVGAGGWERLEERAQ